MANSETNRLELQIHFNSKRQKVFEFIATGKGRAKFWADLAEESDGRIEFRFSNGQELSARILASEPPRLYSCEYFGGSRVTFALQEHEEQGTVLTLTEESIPSEWFDEQRAGWVTVLLCLKAAADFGIDLRNPHKELDWEAGFVDV